MLSWSEESLLFPLCLYEPFHSGHLDSLPLLTACSVLLFQWQHLGVQYLPLHGTLAHFLDVSRTKEKLIFYKANYCPSTVPLSTKEYPMFHSHLGTCSRLAGKKHHVRTLESEKTYSFRCVFSFSVSRTITSLFGSFWDLMSCKTEQRLGVTSCSHWNKGPTKKNRILLKRLGFTWSFLSVQFVLQTCILMLLNPVPNRNRFGLQVKRTPKTLLLGALFHPKPCSVKRSLNFVQAIPLYPEPAYMCSFPICERGCKTSFGGKGDSSHLE